MTYPPDFSPEDEDPLQGMNFVVSPSLGMFYWMQLSHRLTVCQTHPSVILWSEYSLWLPITQPSQPSSSQEGTLSLAWSTMPCVQRYAS